MLKIWGILAVCGSSEYSLARCEIQVVTFCDSLSLPSLLGTLFINQRAEFDPERPSVSIVIEARDGGSPSLSSLTTVQVHISDVNDNAPVFHQSEYRSVYFHQNLAFNESYQIYIKIYIKNVIKNRMK